jgi:hypothetical protein
MVQLVYIDHTYMSSIKMEGHCCNVNNYFAAAHLYFWRGHHLSLVMNGVKVTDKGCQVWVPAVCQIVQLVHIDHTQCLVFRKRPLMQCPHFFAVLLHHI